MPWSIKLVVLWALATIGLGIDALFFGILSTRGPDPEANARLFGRMLAERVILSVVPLVVVGLVLGRIRWVANVVVTVHVALAMAVTPTPAFDFVSSCIAWLLLLSPGAQRFLAREPSDPTTRSLSWKDRLRVAGITLASGLLPGSGQLLNRAYWRAAAHFGIWAAAWITHLRPVWTMACLYSMCEAGWSATALAHARRDPPTIAPT